MGDESFEKKEEERLLRSLEKKKAQSMFDVKRTTTTGAKKAEAPVAEKKEEKKPTTTEPRKPSVYIPMPRDFNRPVNETSSISSLVSPRAGTVSRPAQTVPAFVSPRPSTTPAAQITEEDQKRIEEEEEKRLQEKREVEDRESELHHQTDSELGKKEEERMMKQFHLTSLPPSPAPKSAVQHHTEKKEPSEAEDKHKEEELEKKFLKQLSFGAIGKKKDPTSSLLSPKGFTSTSTTPSTTTTSTSAPTSPKSSTPGDELDEEKKEEERIMKQLHLTSLGGAGAGARTTAGGTPIKTPAHQEDDSNLTPEQKREREARLAEEKERELIAKSEAKMAHLESTRMFKQLGVKK
eukprot:TRINITY_DN2601_c0_g1_i1.p1 TRINITY_DN2601_c0_g1~~TRINITY_DN2601_c0_g1_i1.p1  ORF type:complete len:350 (-),score=169.53 TRINITY_DN2601_c0_g1_i1:40-1089(-)